MSLHIGLARSDHTAGQNLLVNGSIVHVNYRMNTCRVLISESLCSVSFVQRQGAALDSREHSSEYSPGKILPKPMLSDPGKANGAYACITHDQFSLLTVFGWGTKGIRFNQRRNACQ